MKQVNQIRLVNPEKIVNSEPMKDIGVEHDTGNL